MSMTALSCLVLDVISFVRLFGFIEIFTQSGPGVLFLNLFSTFSNFIKAIYLPIWNLHYLSYLLNLFSPHLTALKYPNIFHIFFFKWWKSCFSCQMLLLLYQMIFSFTDFIAFSKLYFEQYSYKHLISFCNFMT